MSHFMEDNHYSGFKLTTVVNKVTKPQDAFPYRNMIGVDKDGETVRKFDLKEEFDGKYFVIFFFPMDLIIDSEEVNAFGQALPEFANEHCEVVGVTADSPWAIKHWMTRDVHHGGFGKPPGFPILSDKDLALSMSLCVARPSGVPVRATIIVDWTGTIRYSLAHTTHIIRSAKEILRLVQAFRHSDLTGEALASGWTPGGEHIPTDFTKKVAYFLKKFGSGDKSSQTSSSKLGDKDEETDGHTGKETGTEHQEGDDGNKEGDDGKLPVGSVKDAEETSAEKIKTSWSGTQTSWTGLTQTSWSEKIKPKLGGKTEVASSTKSKVPSTSH